MPTELVLDLDLVVEAPPPADLGIDALRRLVDFVLRAEGARGRWQITVVLVDDERLGRLHRDFMGLDTPTDVMTFPLGDRHPGAGMERGGDVVVSVERAAAQAGDYGQTADQEVRFLVVHGLLHLCGWGDATERERAGMLERQAVLLAAFDATVAASSTGFRRRWRDA